MIMNKSSNKKHQIPSADKNPDVVPDAIPDLPLVTEEDPDIIPEEDPYDTPAPYEKPEPGEGP